MLKKIFIIAGEASGDSHGANLIEALREFSREPLEIYGVGGDKIKATGAREFFDLAHIHVTGLTPAIKNLPKFTKAAKIILASIEKVRPNLVVLIDNPGFNLHLAKKIHALKIPIVYYISPQLWAWKQKRVFKIKAWVSKMLVVFEFEKKIYEDHGVPVSFVGHPLKDSLQNIHAKKMEGSPCISLLPGSRKNELQKLLPIFLEAASDIHKKMPSSRFLLIKAPTLSKAFYEKFLKKVSFPLTLVDTEPYEKIKGSDLAILCSGTATLECAILGVPMIIVNKGTFITYMAVKSVIRVPYLGLPNLILGREAFKEFMQYQATGENISKEALAILGDKERMASMKKDLEIVSEKLGIGGANKNAAKEVLKLL